MKSTPTLEHGFSFIELTIALSISSILAAASYRAISSTTRTAQASSQETAQRLSGIEALNRLNREIRLAEPPLDSELPFAHSANSISFPRRTRKVVIAYHPDKNQITRTEWDNGKGRGKEILADQVTSFSLTFLTRDDRTIASLPATLPNLNGVDLGGVSVAITMNGTFLSQTIHFANF